MTPWIDWDFVQLRDRLLAGRKGSGSIQLKNLGVIVVVSISKWMR